MSQLQRFANFAAAQLAVPINTSATSITLQTGQGAVFPTLAGAQYWIGTLKNITTGYLEIVNVLARTGDVLTVIRGQEGTTPAAFSVNDVIELRLTAGGIATIYSSAAQLDGAAFTGTITGPTVTSSDNSTNLATTAFVKNQAYATLASPTLTGDPKAPTPTVGDNDTSIATTAFVTTALATTNPVIAIRQTVVSAPVDSSGFVTLGGSTGGTTVVTTAISGSSPIVVNAAGGSTSGGIYGDRVGFSTANLTWTGLTTNGTMQLSVDVAANGVLTPVSGALLTTYQQGGTFSIVNGQHTFNIGVMNQTVGNGTTAVQSYRVAVGEVTVAGAVVTTITWYALNGKYDSGYTNTLPAATTSIVKNSNLGLIPKSMSLWTKCLTIDGNNAVGSEICGAINLDSASGSVFSVDLSSTRNTVGFTVGTGGFRFNDRTSGALFAPTAASWAYRVITDRGW